MVHSYFFVCIYENPARRVATEAAASCQVSFGPGTVLFREGDPPDDIYLVVAGEARAEKRCKGASWDTKRPVLELFFEPC